MISPVRNLALAAAALVTGSIASAGHGPAALPPATLESHAGVYSAPAAPVGSPAYCPPSAYSAVNMYTAPAAAPIMPA